MSLDKLVSFPRIQYLDALRGFTMLLVVYAHIRYFSYNVSPFSQGSLTINDISVVFFMPLFFFLSGFLAFKSAPVTGLRTVGGILLLKCRSLILPTLFFYLLYVSIFDIPLMPSLFDKMKAGYWFTLTLFEFFVFYIVSTCILNHFRFSQIGSNISLLLISVVISLTSALTYIGFSKDLAGLFGIAHWWYYIFFIAGTFVRKYHMKIQLWFDSSNLLAFLIVIFFISVYFYNEARTGGHIIYIGFYLLIAITAPFILFVFFRRYSYIFSEETLIGRSLIFIGKRTFEIYLLHYFFLPHNLNHIASYFSSYPSILLEFIVSNIIALAVIGVSIIFSYIICLSDILGELFLGKKS